MELIKMKKIFFLLSVSALFIIGCEDTSTNLIYQKEVVVNATLEAGKSIDTLWLNWTGEVDKYYDPANYAITTAIVIVNGVDVNFIDTLQHDPAHPGRYFSVDTAKKITPTKTYRLTVTVPEGTKQVTAITTVPDTFHITSATMSDGEIVTYNTNAPVHKFYWTQSNNYASYLPTITYLDENPPLIPKAYYPDTNSVDFERPPKIDFRPGVPKDQANSDLPWVFLNYYGNIQFDVYAVDFNITDYLNQVVPNQGGELRDIRFNVQGGIGIFGARTRAAGGFKIYLKPQ